MLSSIIARLIFIIDVALGRVSAHFTAVIIDSNVSKETYIDAMSIVRLSNIGDYSYVSRHSKILMTNIGRYCSIGPECIINSPNHPLNLLGTSPVFYSRTNVLGFCIAPHEVEEYKRVEIGSDVWMGARVMVMGGVKIGHGAVIAAGAVVTKDVPSYAVVGGVPARLLKMRFEPRTVEALLKTKWWEASHSILQSEQYLHHIGRADADESNIVKFCEVFSNSSRPI